jgi:hypothetical protein
MRITNAVHASQPWRIHALAPDFTLEDVWELPVGGRAGDFQGLLDLMVSADPTHGTSLPTRFLWRLRDRLGRWFGLGRISTRADAAPGLAIPGTTETSLAGRLPEALRGTANGLTFRALPFKPLYRTDREFAAELANQTVHGLMHLGWVDAGEGRFRGQMAVYVKPRGRLGRAYMALIRPFRHWIVYPAIMRQLRREWMTRVPA